MVLWYVECVYLQVSFAQDRKKRSNNAYDDQDKLPAIHVDDLSKRMSAFRRDRFHDPRQTVTQYRTRRRDEACGTDSREGKRGSDKSEGTVRQALTAARQQVGAQAAKKKPGKTYSKYSSTGHRITKNFEVRASC